MKKLITLLVVVSLMLMIIVPFGFDSQVNSAEKQIEVWINGVLQEYTQDPVLENGTTLVPMRGIFESLGASLSWNGKDKSITATDGEKEIFLTIGDNTALIDGIEVTLVEPAQLINGTTMVPLRFVSESLGAEVNWNSTEKIITIITDDLNSEFYYYLYKNPDFSNISNYTGRDFEIINNISEGLFRLGPNQEIQYGLAEEYFLSDDGSTITFKLRDANWSNGEPITAQDFVDGWEYYLDYHYTQGSMVSIFFAGARDFENYTKYQVLMEMYENNPDEYYEHIKEYRRSDGTYPTPSEVSFGKEIKDPKPVTMDDVGVKAIDDKTLEVKLKFRTYSIEFFLEGLTFPYFMPMNKEFYEANKTNYGKEADAMLYSGPFKITSWDNEKIIFEKNENYWDSSNVKLEKVIAPIVYPDIDNYNNGQTDILFFNYDEIPLYKADPTYKNELVYDFNSTIRYLEFNNSNPVLANKNIRKALSLSIDRNEFVNLSSYKRQIPATGLIPPSITTLDNKSFRDENGVLVEYDINKAKDYLNKGLEELGLEQLPDLRYLGYMDQYLFFKDQFAKIGVNLVQEEFDNSEEKLQKLNNGDFDIYLNTYHGIYLNPRAYLYNFTSNSKDNHGNWTNSEYDMIFINTTYIKDYNRKNDEYLRAERLLIEEAGIAPMSFEGYYRLTKPYVKGYVRHAYEKYGSWKWMYIEGKENTLN